MEVEQIQRQLKGFIRHISRQFGIDLTPYCEIIGPRILISYPGILQIIFEYGKGYYIDGVGWQQAGTRINQVMELAGYKRPKNIFIEVVSDSVNDILEDNG